MPEDTPQIEVPLRPEVTRRLRLLDVALSLADEQQMAGVVVHLRPAFEEMRGVAVAGLIIDDEEREVVQQHAFEFDLPTSEIRFSEFRISEADSTPTGQPAETYISPPLTPDKMPAVLRGVPASTVRRLVSVPLALPGRFSGRVFAGFRQADPVPFEDVRYLEQLAHIVAPVVWNCFTRERFDRGDRRRDVLITLGGALNASLELEAIIAAAREAVSALASEAGCSIDLLEPDRKHYRAYWAGGSLHPEINGSSGARLLSVAETSLAWVVEHGRTCQSDDLTQRTRFAGDVGLRDAGIRRYVLVPMIVRGRVIGALFMGSTDPHPPLRMDVWLYENIALQVGLAIESARQVRQLQELSEKLAQQNVYLREEISSEHGFNEMIGHSPPIQAVRQAIGRVARTDTTVLIAGQTGVGKELVARAIHAASPRSELPMVKVNCAAIPETMVESELFGHERGAFTSAVEQRIGRFELARDSTLFLDEIGELSLAVQVKLLRVLQDGEFERVGGGKTLKSNARIVAATNRDLLTSIESGSFRRDLYYRLNVFPIHVPTLEERREDIPLLVEAFVAHFSRRMGKYFEGIDPAALGCLVRRAWPGNIRELRHVVERAMILCDTRALHVDCALPSHSVSAPARNTTLGPSARTLDQVQAEHIRQVLSSTDYVIEGPGGAAAVLGIHPSTLRSRMKRLGVDRPTRQPR